MEYYVALIDWDGRIGCSIRFPDLPGCGSAASNSRDVIPLAAAVLSAHVDGLRGGDTPVPPPRSLEDIRAEGTGVAGIDWSCTTAVLVPLLPPPGGLVDVTVSLPERLLARIDAVALDRSAFLADAANDRLMGGDA